MVDNNLLSNKALFLLGGCIGSTAWRIIAGLGSAVTVITMVSCIVSPLRIGLFCSPSKHGLSMVYKWGVILTTKPSPGMILQLASKGFFLPLFFAPQVLYIQVYRSACLSSQHSTPGERLCVAGGKGVVETSRTSNFMFFVVRVL